MTTPITIVGNATDAPEIRFTTSGKAVCSVTVAVNERKKEGDQWVDGNTSFFRVNCWETLAENVASSITKGMRVVATGRLSVREYDDRDNPEIKRKSVEITADEFGPSLRWATAEVTRGERSSVAPQRDYDPNEEPF